MKKLIILIALCLLGFGTSILQAQNFDRIAISSGGISSDTINATIGEVFVFSVSGGGISLNSGSQSDTNNTGGIFTTATKTENTQSQILVYPNPVKEYMNLRIIGLNSETIAFNVYDATGRLVIQENSIGENNLYRIQVKQLTQGNYFIQGYTPKGETIGKINFIKL
jgi:hypothetical protein